MTERFLGIVNLGPVFDANGGQGKGNQQEIKIKTKDNQGPKVMVIQKEDDGKPGGRVVRVERPPRPPKPTK